MSNFAFRKSVTNDIYSEYYENRKKYISLQGYRNLRLQIIDFRTNLLHMVETIQQGMTVNPHPHK